MKMMFTELTKKIIFAYLIVFILVPNAAFGMDRSEVVKLYEDGNKMFAKANQIAMKEPLKAHDLYMGAIMRFERIVRDAGIKNGKLFYNIGNVYFKMGDIGRAVLNYLRAQEYTRDDPNLAHNLEYARARRLDKVEVEQETKILKTIFFWHYDLSERVRAVIFILFFVLFWIGASVRLFCKKPSWWGLYICLFISLVFLGSVFFDIYGVGQDKKGVIVKNEIIARKGDSETYQPSFEEPLHSGTEFELIERRGEWLHIKLLNEKTCWVLEDAIEFVLLK